MKKQNPYQIVGVVILVLVFLATGLKYRYAIDHDYYLFAVLFLGVLLYSFEFVAKAFAKYWMAFGKFLGGISSKIILSLMFVFILTPISLLKKVLTKSKSSEQSNWVECTDDKMDFTKPW